MPDDHTPSIKARDAIILWNMNGGAKVADWKNQEPGDSQYRRSAGACHAWYHQDPPIQVDAVTLDVIRFFLVMVMRDGVDPQVAYDALYTIEEFRDWIPPDMPMPSE